MKEGITIAKLGDSEHRKNQKKLHSKQGLKTPKDRVATSS